MVRVEIVRENSSFATVRYNGNMYTVWGTSVVNRHNFQGKYCGYISYDELMKGT